MKSQAQIIIWKIHCALSANQKRDSEFNTYIHTYIQTLLKLPKWVFQFNTIKTFLLLEYSVIPTNFFKQRCISAFVV